MKLPNIFVPEKDLGEGIERFLKGEIKSQQGYTRFKVISANTYAEGVAEVKKKGQKPFTFSENVEARIAEYKANGEFAELFKNYLDSVTGVAYKANSTKFKIILRSDKLENIKPDFNRGFIPIDYDAERSTEFDSKKGKYNQPLTREEAKNHEFWLVAMNDNKEKLAEYVDIWFDKTGAKEGMGVYLRNNICTPDEDELWALVLGFYYDDSGADGDNLLNDVARFVSGAQ